MIAIARLLGAAAGAFAGLVAVQLMRMRRMEFLPAWPGFAINHIIDPSTGEPTQPGAPQHRRARRLDNGRRRRQPAGGLAPLPPRAARCRCRDAIGQGRLPRLGRGARWPTFPAIRCRMPPRRRARITAGHSSRSADIVAVVIGSNDATHRTPPNRYRADLRADARRDQETGTQRAHRACRNPGIPRRTPRPRAAHLPRRPVRAPPATDQPRGGGASRRRLRRSVCGGSGAHRRAPGRSLERPFHPSAVGYDAWAEVIFQALQAGPADGASEADEPARGRGRLRATGSACRPRPR